MSDVSFIETEIKRLNRKELDTVFDEVKQVSLYPRREECEILMVFEDHQHHHIRRCVGIPRAFYPQHLVFRRQARQTEYYVAQAVPWSGDGPDCSDAR